MNGTAQARVVKPTHVGRRKHFLLGLARTAQSNVYDRIFVNGRM